MASLNLQQAKQGLKNEVLETLNWFADMDVASYGKIQEGTKEMYAKQGCEIPKKYLA